MRGGCYGLDVLNTIVILVKFVLDLVPASGVGHVQASFHSAANTGHLRTAVDPVCSVDSSSKWWPDQTFTPIDQAWADPGVVKGWPVGSDTTQAVRVGEELHFRAFHADIGTPVPALACWAILSASEQKELRRQLFCRGAVYGTYCIP
jgi:hypothetical protein